MRKVTAAYAYRLLGLAAIALVLYALARWVPVLETVEQIQEAMGAAGIGAPVAYPFLIAVTNILLLPGGILNVGGGFFFGLWWGFALVLFGNMCGAAGAFLIGRMLGRKRVERLLRGRAKWVYLDQAIAREGWKIIVLSQLHPLFPVSLINYVYGITRIHFWPCMLWTLCGRAPGILLYVYLGTLGQFGMNLLRGKSTPILTEYVLWIGGLVLLIALTGALSHLSTKLLREAEARAALDLEQEAPVEDGPELPEPAVVPLESDRPSWRPQ